MQLTPVAGCSQTTDRATRSFFSGLPIAVKERLTIERPKGSESKPILPRRPYSRLACDGTVGNRVPLPSKTGRPGQPSSSVDTRLSPGLTRFFLGDLIASQWVPRRRRLLLDHSEKADDLVAGLHDQSEGLLRSVQDALKEVEKACQGEEQKSWEVFQRIFAAGQAIKAAAAEFGLSYQAAAMRVQRIKKKVRSRALELALQRGLTP